MVGLGSMGWDGFEQIVRDLRFGCRLLAKTPGFTITAFLTLALGIGASVAVFAVIDSIVLKPLSYRDSGRLVAAWERIRFLSADPIGPNPRHVDIWRRGSTELDGLVLLKQGAQGVAVKSEHPLVIGTVTSEPMLFDVLRVRPLLGRGFRSEDSVQGHNDVAILSFSLWQRLFQGNPNVLGKTIRVSGTAHQIIGILPADFQFPNQNTLRAIQRQQAISAVKEPELFLPAVINLNELSWNGEYGNWIALGRLKAGISIEQANAQLASMETRVVAEMPLHERYSRLGAPQAFLQPMQEAVVGDSKTDLWLLMIAVLGLLLIACLNLANGQLGRAVLRQREAALRSAVGASKWALLRNALAENLVLATAGGLGGIVLATAALKLFRYYSPVDLPRSSEVHLNAAVLAFSLIAALSSCLLFGMLPAIRVMRVDPQLALQQSSSRVAGSSGGRYLRTWLIALQICGCTVLLLVTGLFVKSLLHLLREERGFETRRVAVAEVDLFDHAYEDKQSRIDLDDTILRALRALPEVQSAGLINNMPLEGESWIESLRRTDRPQDNTPLVNLRWVSPGIFETIQENLVAGRFFEERDRNLSSVVLSRSEARALWPTGGALGGEIIVEGRKFHVIGIVSDARTTSLKSSPPQMAYLHYKDRPPFAIFFMVRGRQSAEALLSDIRRVIWSAHPDVTIARVKTLDSQLTDSLSTERFVTLILLAFASSALFLAVLGIYGVLNYSVVSRRKEIGVRITLGATHLQIYSLVMREVGVAVIGGMVAGLLAGIAADRFIQTLIYGVRPMDPPVVVLVIALLLLAALIAAFLPAFRAASLDPMNALRYE